MAPREVAPQATAKQPVDERRPLDFHTPYGCSKGAAEQYVLDYARSYGLRAAVFRMSCIYGPRQFGTEDQGWVAHFGRALLTGEPSSRTSAPDTGAPLSNRVTQARLWSRPALMLMPKSVRWPHWTCSRTSPAVV